MFSYAHRALAALPVLVAIAAAPIHAATLTVTSSSDNIVIDGQCTLREAIIASNAAGATADCPNTGAAWGTGDTIAFNIPGGGTHTIQPLTALPMIARTVVLDGYTQTGASPNTLAANAFPNALGLDTRIMIQINGSLAPADSNGISLGTFNSTVRGLSIFNFGGTGAGILVAGTPNLIEGNFVGIRADGTTSGTNNGRYGVRVDYASNSIGGTTAASRNLISGHTGIEVFINGANANLVAGNLIGTDITGTLSRLSVAGVAVQANASVVTGTAIRNNVISGVGGYAIDLQAASLSDISGNTIGVAVGGGALGNMGGITIVNRSALNGVDNVINGNGIANSQGLVGMPALGYGISVYASGGAIPDPVRQRFDGNFIWDNAGLGINLLPSGEADGTVTANDAPVNRDTDLGPNRLQNFPVIGSAVGNGTGGVDIAFTLDSAASRAYAITAYANDSCDPSGYGEGRYYSGSPAGYTADGNGNVTATLSYAAMPSGWAVGKWVTLLATDTASNETSEFSACAQIAAAPGMPAATPTPASVNFGNQAVGLPSATRTVTITNTGTANLSIAGGGVTLAGANAGDFAVTADTCAGATVTPAATCTVTLRFTPAAAGARAANLSVASNDPASPLSVPLSGNGTAPGTPAATPTPPALVFGGQTVGTSSAPQTLTITNTGGAPLTITTTGIGPLGEFTIQTNSCLATLAPAASCAINVVFAPSAAGARAATLSVTSDDPASPLAVPLSGTGTAAAPGAGVAGVPTLSEWGMILLGLLLAGVAGAGLPHRGRLDG